MLFNSSSSSRASWTPTTLFPKSTRSQRPISEKVRDGIRERRRDDDDDAKSSPSLSCVIEWKFGHFVAFFFTRFLDTDYLLPKVDQIAAAPDLREVEGWGNEER